MRKKTIGFFLTAALTASVGMPVFAATSSGQNTSGTTAAAAEGWQQDTTGWWWRNADGSYPVNQWKEVNGKQYYFGTDGYMLVNTTTPDGYQVDADGAWVENGIVQQKAVQAPPVRASLTGAWKGYEEITGYLTTYTFNADGTVHYDIISNYYSDYHVFGDTTYTLDGNKILINSDDFYVNFAGNMRLDGDMIIAQDAAEEGEFDIFFYKQ